MAAAGYGLGTNVPLPMEETQQHAMPVTPLPPPPPVVDGQQLAAALPSTRSEAPGAPVFTEGKDSYPSPLWFMGSLLALSLLIGGLLVRRIRLMTQQVTDSPAFLAAMKAWMPVAVPPDAHHSPRAVKRFINRTRYLAMLQQAEQPDERPMALRLAAMAREQWHRLRRKPLPAVPAAAAKARIVEEHRIVALAALHARFGPRWREWIDRELDFSATFATDDEEQIQRCLSAYTSTTDAPWPPTEEELDSFEQALKGVRVEGDVETIDSRAPTPRSSRPARPTAKRQPPPSKK